MKLLRYGPVGREKPGILDSNGIIRDLSPILSDLTSEYLSPTSLAALAGIRLESLAVVSGTPRFCAPYTATHKFIAIGLNHSHHPPPPPPPSPPPPLAFSN